MYFIGIINNIIIIFFIMVIIINVEDWHLANKLLEHDTQYWPIAKQNHSEYQCQLGLQYI